MKASTIRWHLARDNQAELAKFCEKHETRSEQRLNTHKNEDGREYWERTSYFDNGGYITAELLHGGEVGYTVADHFQVVNYNLGG